MSGEYFWCCELNKNNPECLWDPEEFNGDDNDANFSHTLVLKKGVLGLNAINNELNMVEVQTEGYNGDLLSCSILRLRSEGLEQCEFDIFFPHATTFRLISGTGPVHLCGQHVLEVIDDDDEDDEIEEENGDISEESPARKRKTGNIKKEEDEQQQVEENVVELPPSKQKKQNGKMNTKKSTKRSAIKK